LIASIKFAGYTLEKASDFIDARQGS